MHGKSCQYWLALNFLWYLVVGFCLAHIPVWAQAVVVLITLALMLAYLLKLRSIVTLPLTSGLAAALANALAGNFIEDSAGNLATAFAMVVFLGWTAPGIWSVALAGTISLAAA